MPKRDSRKVSTKELQGLDRPDILYVIGSLDVGGSERHLATLAKGLLTRGFRPIIYCLSHPGVQAPDLRTQGVEILGPWFACNTGPKWRRGICIVFSALRLFGLMLMMRPSIVHFFLPMSYVIGAPLAIVARVPRRLMSRRSLNHYQRKHRILAWLERRLHNRMSVVLGNSRAITKELADEGCDTCRIGLIYNGVDIGLIDSVTEFRSHQSLTLLIVANLIPYKGHSDLIRALAYAADRLPPGWTLLCAGRDDGIGDSLRQLAADLDIADHIQWLGERSDVPNLLKSADIGLLCSHEEGFSNALLEAMAAGLPMIVTEVGGNPEAVASTGLIVPSRDPTSLGDAIVTLATNANLRIEMGKAARERVRQYFTIERCLTHYVNLYRSLELGRIPRDIAIEPML